MPPWNGLWRAVVPDRRTGGRGLPPSSATRYNAPMDLLDTQIFSLIGEEGFTRLVAAFYKRVPTDDILGPMYEKQDLEGAELRLRGFLIQRFGGPSTYSEKRGHPRLRMRHAPFKVDLSARNRWLQLMNAALDEVQLPKMVDELLRPFFVSTANFMINAENA